MPIFDDFWALLNFFYFPASRLYLALVVVGTTVPKQRLFISANSWWLLALLEMVFFCEGSVVLRHCWELVHQCRKDCYSTMPTFDNFLALLNIFLFSGGNFVLRRCWWLVHQCRKNAFQQCQFSMIFGHCLIFYFPASRLYLALVVVGTTVPKQRLFLSANFDDCWHSWKCFFLAAMLYFGTVEG